MSANMAAFQALLAEMRAAFLDELPERCAGLEAQILQLERSPGDRDVFNALYRGVHSLKGSGGTHGVTILTTLCHQLENLLSEADARQDFGKHFATAALAYIDLLRQVPAEASQAGPDYSAIEAQLEGLRQSTLMSRKAGLIVESSASQAELYRQALAGLPVQLSAVGDGLTALERLLHEPFDFVIVGRELKQLNGIALMAALRTSETRNQRIPLLLLTSRRDAIPDHVAATAVIARDRQLTVNLADAVRSLLGSGA